MVEVAEGTGGSVPSIDKPVEDEGEAALWAQQQVGDDEEEVWEWPDDDDEGDEIGGISDDDEEEGANRVSATVPNGSSSTISFVDPTRFDSKPHVHTHIHIHTYAQSPGSRSTPPRT